MYCIYHKKHETLTANPPIHVYINRINNRLIFKIKDGYKLELQSPEMMNLFDSTKKLIDKIKNGENVENLEVVKVVLVQCKLVLHCLLINRNEALLYRTKNKKIC